jgi:D-3-phosphoglycerate dehydrogenase
MEMRLIAYDPFVPEERARMLGTEMVSLEELLRESDFVTLHTPLTEGTKHLIGEREINTMKPTARLINVARGGLIDEEALREAVEEGRLAGAAVDVFTQEPTTDKPLIPPETLSFLAPHMQVATKTALVATQLCEGQIGEIQLTYSGDVATYDTTPLRAAAIRGLMRPISEEMVNIVNADLVAARRHLRISEQRGPSHDLYNDLITIHINTSAGPDVPPGEGYLLLCDNRDQPGMIGAVGTLVGSLDVNISFMSVGRQQRRGHALMVLTLDEGLTPEQLDQVRKIPNIYSVKLVRL